VVPISEGLNEFSHFQSYGTVCECHPSFSSVCFDVFLPTLKEAGAWRSSYLFVSFKLRKNANQNPCPRNLHAVHGNKFMLYKYIAIKWLLIILHYPSCSPWVNITRNEISLNIISLYLNVSALYLMTLFLSVFYAS